MIGLSSVADVLAPCNGADLARTIGVTRTTVHRIKRGAPIDPQLIVPIADALDIDLATFMLVVARDRRT
jgi:transcriptional regulator with XRE-family HTH domain